MYKCGGMICVLKVLVGGVTFTDPSLQWNDKGHRHLLWRKTWVEGLVWWILLSSRGEGQENCLQPPTPALACSSSTFLGSCVPGQGTAQEL